MPRIIDDVTYAQLTAILAGLPQASSPAPTPAPAPTPTPTPTPAPAPAPAPSPADPVAVFRSLTSQDARDAFLHGMDSRTHNRLLQMGLTTAAEINAASLNVVQNFGGAGGLDRATGRPWVIYRGEQERTYF